MCVSPSVRNDGPLPMTVDSAQGTSTAACSKRSKSHRAHLIVQHNYHDHAYDPSPCVAATVLAEESNASNNSNAPTAFPLKLYEMLSSADGEGFSDIVSWQPHGRCFVVHKADKFSEILPRFFKLSKVASFQRQLNLYGFTRLTAGMDKGGYYNELFLRGKPWLCHKIHRVKVKGTGVRAKSNPAQEPDFWRMPWVGSSPQDTTTPATTASTNTVTPSPPVKIEISTASSVVSHDEEEHRAEQEQFQIQSSAAPVPPPLQLPQQPLRLPSQPLLPLQRQVESNVPLPGAEPEEDSLIFSWGMPFHYLRKHPRESQLASSPMAKPHHRPSRGGDTADPVVSSLGLDDFISVLVDAEQHNSTFSELLERAIQ